MRSQRRRDTAILALLMTLAAPSVMAAGLSLSRVLPRANVGAIFEIERSSPSGPSGSAASDPARPSAVRDAEIEAEGVREGTGATPPPPRSKPGGVERAPRWKSLIPGALK